MNDDDKQLLSYAQVFDRTVDFILPGMLDEADQRTSFRHKAAGKLQENLLSVAKSIVKLTKIAASVELAAVSENSQSILSLSRVLVELCNKLAYLAISPADDKELKLRTLYFSLVGAVNYRKLIDSIEGDSNGNVPHPGRDPALKKADQIITLRQDELAKAGFGNWQPFSSLNPEMQKRALKGKTQEDYLKDDFEDCLSHRLNPNEHKHYKDLGNVAIHSSAFVMAFFDDGEENQVFIAGVACLALYNAARHLALCTLEAVNRFPELKTRIDSDTMADLRQLAEGLKKPNHLND
jgi:hypothetical protein